MSAGRWLSNTDPALRRCWLPVARSEEVGDEPVRVRLLGTEWMLARRGSRGRGGLRLGADPEPAGLAERDGLVFLAPDEPVTDLPAFGGAPSVAGTPSAAPAPSAAGVPDPAAPAPAPTPTPMTGDLEPVRARVGAGLMIDNFLDMAHFPFIHAATIGTDEAARVNGFRVERRGLGMTVRGEHPFPNHEDPLVAAGERPLIQRRRVTYTYVAPFSVELRIDYRDAGGTNVIAFHVQPEDDETCRLYTRITRDDLGGDEQRLAEAVAFEHKVLAEDLALQERYRDRRLPLDLPTEVHVKADLMTVELRRILSDLTERAAAGTLGTGGARATAAPSVDETERSRPTNNREMSRS